MVLNLEFIEQFTCETRGAQKIKDLKIQMDGSRNLFGVTQRDWYR